MKCPWRKEAPKTQAKVVQAGVSPREPLIHPGVVKFRTADNCLHGLDIRGNVVLLAHLSDVSLAVVEDVPPDDASKSH